MDTADNALLQENIILKAELAVARAKNSEDAYPSGGGHLSMNADFEIASLMVAR